MAASTEVGRRDRDEWRARGCRVPSLKQQAAVRWPGSVQGRVPRDVIEYAQSQAVPTEEGSEIDMSKLLEWGEVVSRILFPADGVLIFGTTHGAVHLMVHGDARASTGIAVKAGVVSMVWEPQMHTCWLSFFDGSIAAWAVALKASSTLSEDLAVYKAARDDIVSLARIDGGVLAAGRAQVVAMYASENKQVCNTGYASVPCAATGIASNNSDLAATFHADDGKLRVWHVLRGRISLLMQLRTSGFVSDMAFLLAEHDDDAGKVARLIAMVDRTVTEHVIAVRADTQTAGDDIPTCSTSSCKLRNRSKLGARRSSIHACRFIHSAFHGGFITGGYDATSLRLFDQHGQQVRVYRAPDTLRGGIAVSDQFGLPHVLGFRRDRVYTWVCPK